ncbi:hypothetical protein [Burkholderia vietnamiensis]|uniref:DUF5983 family protein n=1 Tax=Burkholderia vietnamiensis TaxID=60552 RepID=UPI0012D4247B|nr:hypothetical protein [Burkholderia vietnamiensis]MBR8189111.1 hypothetical protein [Burkholderia vietnamiensis]HDR9174327.1 hypothetical protein [Burkholderia vietnamiensis]
MTTTTQSTEPTGVLRYLDVSTGHVTAETMDWFDDGKCSALTVAPYTYGAFVSVPFAASDIDDVECPEDLKTVLKFARNLGCDVIRFDADADTLVELPRYTW